MSCRLFFPRPHPAVAACLWALLTAACGVSNATICQQGIAKRQACDANLAFAANAVSTCEAQLAQESHTCHNGADLLSICLSQSPCADAVSNCRSQQMVVNLNCSRDPLAPQ